MVKSNEYKAFVVSSLDKVFLNDSLDKIAESALSCSHFTALQGETLSFQVAYTTPSSSEYLSVFVESDNDILNQNVTIRSVETVAVEYPCHPEPNNDDGYLTKDPGLVPDLLKTLDYKIGKAMAVNNQWRSLWIEINLPIGTVFSELPVKIVFKNGIDETVMTSETKITFYSAVMPKQKLIHTEWFYANSIADYYKLEPYSETHWEYLENFVKAAVKRGINTILTPIHTQPLDNEFGRELTNVQLVDITVEGGKYSFGFEKFDRWIEMCLRSGVEYFEMSHLFSQWGAKYAPNIYATVDGEYKKIFGWETLALSDEYKAFLREYVTSIVNQLKKIGIAEKTFFHISDEPWTEIMKDYIAAKNIVADILKDFRIIDALSNYEFYEIGAVTNPVPANDHIMPFIEKKVPDLWTYYCTAQAVDVSNRYMALPSFRNRIIGIQMYKYGISGFLHWGFNSYYSQLSRFLINPYVTTDAFSAYPAGDSFLVYPGENGIPDESIRIMVFAEAIQDIRALELLETFVGKEKVVELIDNFAFEEKEREEVTFNKYPQSKDYIILLRNEVNRQINCFLSENKQ